MCGAIFKCHRIIIYCGYFLGPNEWMHESGINNSRRAPACLMSWSDNERASIQKDNADVRRNESCPPRVDSTKRQSQKQRRDLFGGEMARVDLRAARLNVHRRKWVALSLARARTHNASSQKFVLSLSISPTRPRTLVESGRPTPDKLTRRN